MRREVLEIGNYVLPPQASFEFDCYFGLCRQQSALEQRPEEAPRIPWTEPKTRKLTRSNILATTWLMNPTVRSDKSKALERRPEEAPRIP